MPTPTAHGREPNHPRESALEGLSLCEPTLGLLGCDRLDPGFAVDLGHGEHVPLTVDPFQRVAASVTERESGTCDEGARRRRHEDVAGTAQRHHAGADDHRDAAELLADLFALAEVDARADLDAELPHRFGGGARASDRGGRFGEAREEAVAGGVQLLTTEALQLSSDDRVMTGDQFLPASVSHPAGHRGGVHDVGEQDRGQRAGAGSTTHAGDCA